MLAFVEPAADVVAPVATGIPFSSLKQRNKIVFKFLQAMRNKKIFTAFS